MIFGSKVLRLEKQERASKTFDSLQISLNRQIKNVYIASVSDSHI